MTFDRIHMDEVFSRKLGNYRVAPPDEVWEGVCDHLRYKKRARRKVYLQVAASLVGIVVAGTLLLARFGGPVGQTASEQGNSPTAFSHFVREPGTNPSATVVAQNTDNSKDNVQSTVAGQPATSSGQPEKSLTSALTAEQDNGSQQGRLMDRQDEMSRLAPRKSLFTGITADDQEKVALARRSSSPGNAFDVPASQQNLPQKQYSALSLKAAMSPVMSFRHIPENTSRFDYNTNESRLFSYSGGVNFGISFSDRITVRSGLYYSQLGQTLSKIVLGSNDFARQGEDVFVKLNNSLGQVQVRSGKLLKAKSPESIRNIANGNSLRKFSYRLDASVIQRFEYLRIPLMLEYTVVDKRMDVNVVGGLHSNFLVNEGVYLKNDAGATQQIGNTSNISRFNYSGSLGLGLEYALANQINMYLEPTVDYFLNPINQDETKTYPYSFAVYTGLSISF